MKIVIDIDEKLYDTIMEDIMPTYDELIPLVTRVYEGTPLPDSVEHYNAIAYMQGLADGLNAKTEIEREKKNEM